MQSLFIRASLLLFILAGAGVFSFSISADSVISGVDAQAPAAAYVSERVLLPELDARAAYAVYENGDTRTVLINRRAAEPLPIASITKLATAAVALSGTTTDAITIVSDRVSGKGSLGRYSAGEVFETEALIKAMLIESDNDAAQTIADALGPDFIERMNDFAGVHGMDETVFYNPTGLDPNAGSRVNRASAHDVAAFAEYIHQNHAGVAAVGGAAEYILHTNDQTLHHVARNTNELVTGPSNTVLLAGKTGHTPRAKKNLVVLVPAPFGAPGYITAVVLNTDDHFGDMEALLEWVRSSFNWREIAAETAAQ